jgi:hypothetical protein
MKTNKATDFPLRKAEVQMLIDALEILSPDNDRAESLRIHLLDRLYTARTLSAQGKL